MALLKASRRGELGTHKVRRLRRGGRIPGVLYGHGEQTVAISLDLHDVSAALKRRERLLEVELDGRKENALFKEVQYDPLGQEILHVDLTRVSLDERVEVTVPIQLRGTPAGAAEEGVLQQLAMQVVVECLVTSIPEVIRVNVEPLKVGDRLLLKDLPLPEGTKLVGNPEDLVCMVVVLAEEVAPAAAGEEAAAAEPEVIGRKVEEGEAGEEEPGKPGKPEKAEKPEKPEKKEKKEKKDKD